jgi:polyferredoxin
LADLIRKIKGRGRLATQILFAAFTNSYVRGFAKGRIFTGKTKYVCVPGLNCYSCPGALGACPLGALQNTFAARGYKFAFYATGFLLIIGAVLGRVVCGFLCPFGLIQDLIYKIPFVRKFKKLPADRVLKWLKYVLLVLFVILLPLFAVDATSQGKPWFCEYICPSGTLTAGIPLVLANKALRSAIGFLYAWKIAVLSVIILLSVIIYRPFCRYICPLGAIYGLFNPIALYRFTIDSDKCIKCGECEKVCKMNVSVFKKPNSVECIRCGDCRRACPTGAIKVQKPFNKDGNYF